MVAAMAGEESRGGARNLVVVVLDSLRYDSWIAAEPEGLRALGPVERRWSYATWTAPSHYNLLMGLLPHTSPPEVYASEYYKQDFLRYSERLERRGDGVQAAAAVDLPADLPASTRSATGPTRASRCRCSTRTRSINRDFDSFELMPKHNDMAAMLRRARVRRGAPSFYLLNVGETHYPTRRPTRTRASGRGSPASTASSSASTT